ncbi:MAG TPA: TolC family protein, partial [Gemmatimonadaceae bacterium]|nr:TolC family protein [Gemmatimonadaceae bacterium]
MQETTQMPVPRGYFLGLALLAAPAIGAQSAPATIDFDTAVAIALREHVGVRQAQNALTAEEAAVRQSRLALLPNLSLNVSGANSLGRTFDQAEGRVVDQTSRSVSTGVSSSVTLFDGFKNLANVRSAELGERASEQSLARARQTAVFTVASN